MADLGRKRAQCQCLDEYTDCGDDAKARPVCGSDDVTYASQCSLDSIACHHGNMSALKDSSSVCSSCKLLSCSVKRLFQFALDVAALAGTACVEKKPFRQLFFCGSPYPQLSMPLPWNKHVNGMLGKYLLYVLYDSLEHLDYDAFLVLQIFILPANQAQTRHR